MKRPKAGEWLTVGADRFLVIRTITILYEGWECDSVGYVVCGHNGREALVLTDHGTPYFAKKHHAQDRMKAYQAAMTQIAPFC